MEGKKTMGRNWGGIVADRDEGRGFIIDEINWNFLRRRCSSFWSWFTHLWKWGANSFITFHYSPEQYTNTIWCHCCKCMRSSTNADITFCTRTADVRVASRK
jgi:hypothetical protein